MKRLFLAAIAVALVFSGSARVAAYPAGMRPYMQPVDSVLAAMGQHNRKLLANAYTADAVIVDDQQPYRWSGATAPSDWLSSLTTFGKLHYARFTAFAYPMQIVHGPDAAYITVIGRLRGTGQRAGLTQFATMTFTLSKVGNEWKITSQSWTDIPPPKP
jgi:ketosteroid isomerase-like protein